MNENEAKRAIARESNARRGPRQPRLVVWPQVNAALTSLPENMLRAQAVYDHSARAELARRGA